MLKRLLICIALVLLAINAVVNVPANSNLLNVFLMLAPIGLLAAVLGSGISQCR